MAKLEVQLRVFYQVVILLLFKINFQVTDVSIVVKKKKIIAD